MCSDCCLLFLAVQKLSDLKKEIVGQDDQEHKHRGGQMLKLQEAEQHFTGPCHTAFCLVIDVPLD